MTFRLVTLEEAKRNLRYESSDTSSDARLLEIIEDASRAVMQEIDFSIRGVAEGWTDSSGMPLTDSVGDPATDSNGEPLIPRSVRRATLLAVGILDEHPSGDVDPISDAVRTLLRVYIDPRVA